MTPPEPIGSALLTGYYVVLGVLACYGLHRLSLLIALVRHRGLERGFGPALDDDLAPLPFVTVQLPIYNERNVASRLVRAACHLDYPRDRFEVQVLDDSTDETSALVLREIELQQARGIEVRHMKRTSRTGFKAGALEEGQKQARGELLAVFDADFLPQPDFLKRTVPQFRDSEVGMVQARWDHLNRESSVLTRAQAILLDGHFAVEHQARFLGGRFFNFNGTAGVWRKRAILEAGGWQHDTLTEDLDLSYRAQLAGWRFVYLDDVAVPAELPSDVSAFKSQQRRWAKGSAQTCRKLLGQILRSPLPLLTRAEAFIHLTGNMTYVLMVALTLLMFPAMLLRRGDDSWKILAIDLPLFLAATLAVVAFYLVGQRRVTRTWSGPFLNLPATLALGIGLSASNALAVIDGLRNMGGIFVRTPKKGEVTAGHELEPVALEAALPGYRNDASITLLVEALFALYLLGCFTAAVLLEMWWALPFLGLFLCGYGLMAILGLRELIPNKLLPTGEVALAEEHLGSSSPTGVSSTG